MLELRSQRQLLWKGAVVDKAGQGLLYISLHFNLFVRPLASQDRAVSLRTTRSKSTLTRPF